MIEEKLKKIIRESIVKYLKQECNENIKLITEMWSYSDDMDKMLNYVYDNIAKDTYKSQLFKIDDGIGLRKGTIQNLKIFEVSDVILEYYIYECYNDELCYLIMKEGHSENYYSEKEKRLVITLYTVNGQLIEEPSNKNLSHELEHILQISLGTKNNKNYSQLMNKAYSYASEVIANTNNNQLFEKTIAWLVYYSNPHEQDAFMNEYYQDLRNNKQFINDKNSETHIRFDDYSQKCDFFKNNLNNQKLIDVINQYKIYGYNVNNFQIMINKGLNRFKKKMNNVEKHFKNVIKEANESNFRLPKINNGSLIRI